MFEIHITSLREFRLFVALIKNEPIDPEEVKALSITLEESTAKLLAAEKAQEGK